MPCTSAQLDRRFHFISQVRTSMFQKIIPQNYFMHSSLQPSPDPLQLSNIPSTPLHSPPPIYYSIYYYIAVFFIFKIPSSLWQSHVTCCTAHNTDIVTNHCLKTANTCLPHSSLAVCLQAPPPAPQGPVSVLKDRVKRTGIPKQQFLMLLYSVQTGKNWSRGVTVAVLVWAGVSVWSRRGV